MEKPPHRKQTRIEKLNCKSPLLFIIPSNVYSEEAEKVRDKEAYLRIQKLAKKCEQLREKFQNFEQLQSARIQRTRILVLRTLEVNSNIRGKRIE